ncbi:putative serine/arginine repetitive matrix protein 1-like [Cocos nucifera]|uniref:Putative serine/arginine repetitive matrix protein 1-like n=1 Tax=Cocos nucifera TaxID=13894 RepID=A0A8K0N867_COCNU|nr:putative serine/arginine repetitive matrix protein 1-like [Cocos nucifera]
MAEPNPPLHPTKPPTPTFGTAKPRDQNASAKFLSNFLYKTIFFAIFLALLPLFPSQAPESTNQSIFARSWELLHLLIVGIAISYGLFSHRNTEPELEKEAALKADGPQSYLSQILHGSSVFDDYEVGSPHRPLDESKIQTWSSPYYRNNPAVVVKQDDTNVSQQTNKPLRLPIRSLKSCAQDSGFLDSCDEFIDGHSGSAYGIEEPRIFDALNSKNETKGSASAALPSPRLRSGRMEVKDELASGTGRSPPPPSCSPPSRLPSFYSPRTHTPCSSEDMGRKKSLYKSTPPSPPPPPPPFLGHHGYSRISEKNVDMKSFKDELKDLSRRGREGFRSANDSGFDSLMSAPKLRDHAESSSVGRPVRPKEVHGAMPDQGTKAGAEQSFRYEAHQLSPAPRYQSEVKNELIEKVIVSSEDSDSDDDAGEVSNSAAEAGPDDSEVDKKADEFIAKFREQIRLQRIEAIKKSSGQRNLRNPK